MAIPQYSISNLNVNPELKESYRYGSYAKRSVDYDIISYLVTYTLQENPASFDVEIRISAEDFQKHATVYFKPEMYCLVDRITLIVQQYEQIKHRDHLQSTFLCGEIAKENVVKFGYGGLRISDIQAVSFTDSKLNQLKKSLEKANNEMTKYLQRQNLELELIKKRKDLSKEEREEFFFSEIRKGFEIQMEFSKRLFEVLQRIIELGLQDNKNSFK